ncbi:MAG: PilT/PilU family type 4a pilus ATPase [Lachnospiraceae bacterium]|nr:PilT/PilU family type 4a pilus ATPase [Lachnospiraceae bacterium]
MELVDILKNAVKKKASDIFLVVGQPITYKIENVLVKENEEKLWVDDTKRLTDGLYELANRDSKKFALTGDDDFSVSLAQVGRFRVNVFRQRGSCSAVLRVVNFTLPDYTVMGIPDTVMNLANLKKGLVLVTGAAGSGKSTTISYIIDRINETRNCHILTLEDPIEFLHKHKNSIVSQREINLDSESYAKALRAGMRQSPDVILVGEMRDLETIEIAMTAAETGHLVLSTLHTVGASNAIDRIIDVFPAAQQQQMRFQMSMVLQAIVSQQLVPGVEGRQLPAFEILKANNAIRTLIREGKGHQIGSAMQASAKQEMKTMDMSLAELYREGRIEESVALDYSSDPDTMRRLIGR